MPELPEVENLRRGLLRHLPGRRVTAAAVQRDDLRWRLPRAAFARLVGRRCVAIERRAKYLQIRFDGRDAPVALVHLGMSGRLFVDRSRATEPPPWRPHEHWRLQFGDRLLRSVDPRRFGMLDVVPARELTAHFLLADLGPEPLSPAFDAEYLFGRSRRRRACLKSFLLDSRQVVGVGNIYASEACFRAGVRPGRAAGRLTRVECDRVVTGVRDVLTEAIARGGTTLRDYVGADEDTGWFQLDLNVYDRAGQACRACGTAIRRVVTGARSTYYCPRCQR